MALLTELGKEKAAQLGKKFKVGIPGRVPDLMPPVARTNTHVTIITIYEL